MKRNFISLSVLDMFKMHPTSFQLSIIQPWHSYCEISFLTGRLESFSNFFFQQKESGPCLNSFLLIAIIQYFLFCFTARHQCMCVCSTWKHFIVFICIWQLYHGCSHKIFFVKVRLTLFNLVCFLNCRTVPFFLAQGQLRLQQMSGTFNCKLPLNCMHIVRLDHLFLFKNSWQK